MAVLSVIFLLSAIDGRALGYSEYHPDAIVLGIDGMDPKLLTEYMRAGKMPNFKRLAEQGDFKPLETTVPPQSPVAWSTFSIGANPGVHGVFDFVHRDPKTLWPYLSVTETKAAPKYLKVGQWQFPLGASKISKLRQGVPYWQSLCEAHVPAVIHQVPADYPPTCPCTKGLQLLSGMGTPDLLGTQGTFSYYTSVDHRMQRTIGGGKIYPVTVNNGRVDSVLYGPPHPYKNPKAQASREDALLSIPFTVWVDAENRNALITIQGKEFILNEGEFSDWVAVNFEIIPWLQSVHGIARFFLKAAGAELKLYVSPINIDPEKPALPISQPASYATELFHAVGPFYTQSMAPDTKALEHGVLSDQEFLKQIKIVFEEEQKRFRHVLAGFESGVLFHYFSVLDQLSHVFWRAIDPEHPLYTIKLNEQYGREIETMYRDFDRILGEVLDKAGKDALVLVVSDHGFTSFRWGVNLNTILRELGFIALRDATRQGESEFFENVDWRATEAYNLGINALYINMKGRERFGVVAPEDYESSVQAVKMALEAYIDPNTGRSPFSAIRTRAEVYRGKHLDTAPDLIIGYAEGYRASWDTILGRIPREAIVTNLSPWSGDHAIDHRVVPGVILANRALKKTDPALQDVAPTILKYFRVSVPPEMEGKALI